MTNYGMRILKYKLSNCWSINYICMHDNILFAGLWPWGSCSPLAALDEGAEELSRGLRSQMPVQLSPRHNRLWKTLGWIGSSEWHLICKSLLIYKGNSWRRNLWYHATRLLWCMSTQRRNWAYKWQMYPGCRKKSRNILGPHKTEIFHDFALGISTIWDIITTFFFVLQSPL